MARDGKHIIVCIENIDEEVQAQIALKADREKNVTYTRIAETLAAHFDLIYYIDCESTHYAELSAKRKSGELKVQEEGKDFFAASRKKLDRLVHSEDRERIRNFLDRDHLISALENRRRLTEDYRMLVDGGKTQYTRMEVTYSSDRSHFIICVENRANDVRREQEHLAALSMANEMARRDELTHVKNKTAYHEKEKELQKQIFEDQLRIAHSLDLPVIIHDREAHGDCFEIISRHKENRGVFHCYSGSAEMASELLKMGWYLGFDGPITYKNARKAVEVLSITPLDRILIETDSPYLSPVPLRGKRNDSRNLRFVAEKIAEIKGLSAEEIASATSQNAKKLFRL